MRICWDQLLFSSQTKYETVLLYQPLSVHPVLLCSLLLTQHLQENQHIKNREPHPLVASCRRHQLQTQAVSPPYGFSVEWLGSSQQPLRCIGLQFTTGSSFIFSLDFSPDGSFLVSGGADKRVRLWNIREILGGNSSSRPIQMETEHGDGGVSCIAVSQNNRSIFSGGRSNKTVLIHDSETAKLISCVTTSFSPDENCWLTDNKPEWFGAILDISFQSGSEGNIILPSILCDSALRIYDARRPANKSVIKFLKQHSPVRSAMFSPVDPNQLVCATWDGMYVYDIRKPKSFLHHLSTAAGGVVTNALYSYDARRLLCSGSIAVYDLGHGKQLDGTHKVSLSQSKGLTETICFAGKEDEFLVSTRGKQLFIWQLPSGQGQRTVDSPQLELDGPQRNVLSLAFNKNIGVLASGSKDGTIKLWVPNEQH